MDFEFTRLKANGGGASASCLDRRGRVAKQRCRDYSPVPSASLDATGVTKKLIAPPTESRRWPETPGSVGQLSAWQICRADRCGRCDRRRQICLAPTASGRATGVGDIVGADRFGRAAGVGDIVPKESGVKPSAFGFPLGSLELGLIRVFD